MRLRTLKIFLGLITIIALLILATVKFPMIIFLIASFLLIGLLGFIVVVLFLVILWNLALNLEDAFFGDKKEVNND